MVGFVLKVEKGVKGKFSIALRLLARL